MLGPNHTVAGNPDRLGHGQVTIRSDDEWMHALPNSKRRLVTALTAPLLHHHGYRLSAPTKPGHAPHEANP
jgi:hypothetical protein